MDLPHLELFLAEVGHDPEVSAERTDIAIEHVDARKLPVLDLAYRPTVTPIACATCR